MDRTTLTAALKPLERLGLVAIEADPADRRSRLLRLTGKGGEVLAAAVPIWRSVHAEVEAKLPDPGPDALRGALATLCQPGSSRPGALKQPAEIPFDAPAPPKLSNQRSAEGQAR
jgi:hypothetical protein